jgi:hypothetical protein
MPKHDRPREPFAETVARTAHEIPPAGEGFSYPSPISHREWIDDDGVWWSFRCALNAKQARRTIRDPAIEVIEFYLDERTTVPIADREAYLSKIRPYLQGLGPQTANDHTSYRAAEFRAPDRRRLVIVERSC